jgi:translation elongation factor EF-Tu-like GTPase
MRKAKPHFLALLHYKTTEEGGRKTPAYSRYRPILEFSGLLPLTSGQQIFIDKEVVYPGEMVKAEITILSVKSFEKKLYVGQQFRFFETPEKTVGTGEILEILLADLEKK